MSSPVDTNIKDRKEANWVKNRIVVRLIMTVKVGGVEEKARVGRSIRLRKRFWDVFRLWWGRKSFELYSYMVS